MRNTPIMEEKVRELLREENQSLKNDIFERLDDIVGQLETIREEQILQYHQEKNLEEKVDNHENRIATLEASHSEL